MVIRLSLREDREKKEYRIMNILGIDYGKKRIGLAWMQEGFDVVLPYGIVINDQRSTAKLDKLVQEEKIDKIVVGLPFGLDGGENENVEKVKKFVDELKKVLEIPIEFVDERFTTAEAKQMGGDASLDEKAAMLILQNYRH